ncbi:MAG: hypothetical protein GX621_07615, partial [Pirellulaceae bacterium]|nr:hypothetical protein [Pirellulaceae bacterium]
MLVRAARFFRGFVRVSSPDHRAPRPGGDSRPGMSRATRVAVSSWLAIVIGLALLLPTAPALADSTPKQPAAEQGDPQTTAKDDGKKADKNTDKKTDKAADAPAKQTTQDDAKTDSPEKKESEKKKSFLSTLIKSASGDKTAEKGESDEKATDEKTGGEPASEAASVEVKVEVKPSAKDSRAKASDKKPAPTKKTATVARLRLAGSYPETPETASPFGAASRSLASLLTKFDELAEDKNVAAVLLEIETPDLGGGKLHEIRQAIARYRTSGKPIYAVLTSADANQYVLASACDEIIMPPPGVLLIPGVRAEVTFYKGLFDKLGIQFDVLAMGKYKGAGEPYSRTSMSKPLRESLEALVDHRYEWFVETVADDRKLEDYEIKTLIDRAMFTAQKAKKAGLVDRVVYVDKFVEQLPKRLKADNVKLVSAYQKKTQEI